MGGGLLVLSLAFGLGWAMPNGSPRCVLRPAHSGLRSDFSLNPQILFGAECYSRGVQLRVTLTAAQSFHGFVLKAGSPNDGRFYSGADNRLVASTDHCLTHDSPRSKWSLDADWTPSDFVQGDVHFQATVFVSDDAGRQRAAGSYATVDAYLRPCSGSATPVLDRWVPPAADSFQPSPSWSSTGWTADARATPTRTNSGFDNPDCKADSDATNCDSWVANDVNACEDHSSFVAVSCQQSCCNYQRCSVCQPPTSAAKVSTAACFHVSDENPSGCREWATRPDCEDPNSYVAGACQASCCRIGVRTAPAKASKPSISFSRDRSSCAHLSDDAQYASDCPGWVRSNPSNCAGSAFEATSCKRSCCDASSSSSSSSIHPSFGSSSSSSTGGASVDPYCVSKRDADPGCGDWVKSRADCAVGTFMRTNCHRSCCNVGEYVEETAAPSHAISSSSSHSSHSSVCELDYDPGTFDCPPGQSPFAESKLVWYHCPYCRKCKMFRWSGCGGNANRFETERECQAACDSANPWTKALIDKTGGQRRGACAGKVNSEPIDMEPICDGMVSLNPDLCGKRGWVAENCLASCCQAGYTRK